MGLAVPLLPGKLHAKRKESHQIHQETPRADGQGTLENLYTATYTHRQVD